jgi:hypothetical protein
MSLIRFLIVLLAVCATFTASFTASAHAHVSEIATHTSDHTTVTAAMIECCDHSTGRAPACHVWVAVVPEAAAPQSAKKVRRAANIGPPVTLVGITLKLPLNPPRAG